MAKRSRTAAERAEQLTRLRTRPARARMLAAAHELATARGYESIKAGDIAQAAGVSRETFYTHFADKRSCLAEATDPRLGEIESELRIAAEEGESWATPILESLEETLLERYGSKTSPRGRIIEAMLALVAEHGYASVRLADVIKQAHVSYPSFYRHFASKEECFAAACEGLIAELVAQREESLTEGAGQSAHLVALAELLRDRPASAQILALESSRLPQADGRAGLQALVGPEPLLAGAFFELLRSAILSSKLDRLPADVAALDPHIFCAAKSAESTGTHARRPLPPRPRERRGTISRRSTPPIAAGAPR